ncbi:beta,beta-carotene 15,15'-dioxygenase-like isoform X2 [Lineus longissimus]
MSLSLESKVMSTVSLVLVMVACSCAQPDRGFEYFFTDNDLEMDNIKLKFDREGYETPSWVRGTYVRNGFGLFGVNKRKVLHIFDALGKLTKLDFTNDGVFFSTKFIRSHLYNDSMSKHDIAPYLMFQGVDPDFNPLQKVEALLHGLDNMNINVHRYNKDYVVENDFWRLYQFDLETLNVTRRYTPQVPNFGTMDNFFSLISSAHPLPEFGTQNLVSYVTTVEVGLQDYGHCVISLCRLPNVNDRELISRWKLDRIPYMHSFAATKNYTVLFVGPLFVDITKLIRTVNPSHSLDWRGSDATEIFVTDIKSGFTKSTKQMTGFTMHHINAFEENGRLIMDAVTYPNIDFLHSLQVSVLRNKTQRDAKIPSTSTLNRFILDLHTMRLDVLEHNTTKGYEFLNRLDLPSINENFRYKPYCFVYGNVIKSDKVSVGNVTLVKKDLCNKGGDTVWSELNQYPSEAWFIPKPGSTVEDDGLLISIVLDGYTKTSYLLHLDPKTMKTISRAYMPTFVPWTIHGRFFT